MTTAVEALGPANFNVQLAGRRVASSVGSTLIEAQMNAYTMHTAPLRLPDLKVRERVRVDLPAASGELLSVNQPGLTVPGLTVHTSPGTALKYSFWNTAWEAVTGTAYDFWRNGSVLDAQSVNVTAGSNDCQG